MSAIPGIIATSKESIPTATDDTQVGQIRPAPPLQSSSANSIEFDPVTGTGLIRIGFNEIETLERSTSRGSDHEIAIGLEV